MPALLIRIISRPQGEAPEEIRDKWIGTFMPAKEHKGPVAGVLTENLAGRWTGYCVRWSDAMEALDREHPDARAWWEQYVSSSEDLVFDESCCMVLPELTLDSVIEAIRDGKESAEQTMGITRSMTQSHEAMGRKHGYGTSLDLVERYRLQEKLRVREASTVRLD